MEISSKPTSGPAQLPYCRHSGARDSETIGRENAQTGHEDWSFPNIGASNLNTLTCF